MRPFHAFLSWTNASIKNLFCPISCSLFRNIAIISDFLFSYTVNLNRERVYFQILLNIIVVAAIKMSYKEVEKIDRCHVTHFHVLATSTWNTWQKTFLQESNFSLLDNNLIFLKEPLGQWIKLLLTLLESALVTYSDSVEHLKIPHRHTYTDSTKINRPGHTLGCLLSKGNQANHPKFERPNGKNTKSKNVF